MSTAKAKATTRSKTGRGTTTRAKVCQSCAPAHSPETVTPSTRITTGQGTLSGQRQRAERNEGRHQRNRSPPFTEAAPCPATTTEATIPSSRTGTATWKRIRTQALNQAQDQGLTHCPECGIWLDWAYSKRPNSPEADHIIPHKHGGPDALTNTRVICRHCNQSLGGKDNTRTKPAPIRAILPTRATW